MQQLRMLESSPLREAMKTTPFPYQLEALRGIEKFDGRALIAYPVGSGKAQPMSCNILTPSGWTTMSEIRTGDYAIGRDGRPVRVVAVHPQGVKPIFRVTFRDGSSTECCDDHLWHARYQGRVDPVTLPLSEIRKKLTGSNGRCLYYIPIVAPVEFEVKKTPPLHPYLMGYLLANGCLTQLGIGITIPDEETATRLSGMMPDKVILKKVAGNKFGYGASYKKNNPNPLTVILKDLKVMGCGSHEKFIPKEFLLADVESRKVLLQGLMDGDGCVTNNGIMLEYSTSSQRLAEDFVFLVRSLGGLARTSIKDKPKYTHKGETKYGKTNYRVSVSLPNDVAPFLLSRKASKFSPRTKYQPSRAIVNVEPIGEKNCQCITVDSTDGLYVTDDFIITHNSLISLMYVEKNTDVRPVVVVCPSYLKINWAREASKHLGMRCEILEGMTPSRKPMRRKNSIWIVNYDILGPRRTKDREPLPGWLEFLQDLEPGLLVFDECQYLRTMNTIRTKSARSLAKGVPHILALSGTPLVNRPAELFPILNILRPKEFPRFAPFASEFCNLRRTPWGLDYSGAKNLDVLHLRLKKSCLLRKRKEDILKDLPEKTRILFPVPLSKRKEYLEAEEDFLGWLSKKSTALAKRASKAEQIAKLTYLLQLTWELKKDSVFGWIDDFLEESDEKLLVFGVNRACVESIHEKYRKISVMVHGGITGGKRQDAFDDFNFSSKIRILSGNVQAAGTGWGATNCCNIMLAQLPWAPGEVDQCEGRAHGISRGKDKNPLSTYFLIGQDTAEEDLCQLLQKKSAILSKVLDGDGKLGTLDIYDELTRVLQKRSRGKAR